MIKAIIFDCFGVVLEDPFERAYRSFGGDPEKDKPFIKDVFLKSNSGKISSSGVMIATHLGINQEEWDAASVSDGNVNFELMDYIDSLKPNYKIAMLSNVSKRGLAVHVDVEILKKYFDPIVESSKIGFAKPEARAYEITADKLGVRLDECIMIDDRENYCEGATHVGMHAILYTDVQSLKIELNRLLESKNTDKT